MMKKNVVPYCFVLSLIGLCLAPTLSAWAWSGGPAVGFAAPAGFILPWGLLLAGCLLALFPIALAEGKKKAGEDSRRSNGKMIVSSDFEKVAEVLGECLWQIDRKGRFVYVNSAIESSVGL